VRYPQLLPELPGARRDSRAPARLQAAPWGPGADCTPVTPPAELHAAMPLGARRQAAVARWRREARAILDGADDRLLVIAGPCSLHDRQAAGDYARWLAQAARRHEESMLVVMRAYFEKARTAGGWRGLTSDPGLDGSFDIGGGLRQARTVLLDIADAGIPAATEWVDPLDPLYLGDAVTWGAIGARTVESQGHRLLASALPMPVGFKNGTSGSVRAAVDACAVASAPQDFKSIAPGGGTVRVTSRGNPGCHVVLRGGDGGPNYTAPHVDAALALLAAAGLPRRVLCDASHGNSGKDYRRQPGVAEVVAGQVSAGQRGIAGVMLEGFFQAGRQEPGDPATLAYGQSVTDECMDAAMTLGVLDSLAAAAQARRGAR
jgi:3-deoxy-7-phosphoheptulonate synthase